MLRKWILSITILSLNLALTGQAAAGNSSRSVGLGVSLGAAFPEGDDLGAVEVDDWAASFNWGFYVNIPLVYTFHLTPTAELYRFKNTNATDVSLACKFIVPVALMDLYLGFAPGLSVYFDKTSAHIGGLAGVSFNLISNLDFFVQGKYKILFDGDRNVRVLHVNAGVLFVF